MAVYGYIRTSKRQSESRPGMNPESQRMALMDAGVPDENIYSDINTSGTTGVAERNDWRRLDVALKEGDVLVIASMDRIGRNHQDVMQTVHLLNRRKVRIRSLAESEGFFKLLDSDPLSPEWFAADLIARVMAWSAAQEREALVRRTKAGLERARAEGKLIGRQPKFNEQQRAAIQADHREGMSVRKLAEKWVTSRPTIDKIVAEMK